ncbi:uncharacterized protein UHO2_03983 [Ustilago hordei]|uniref:YMC020W-like alpha/beta hydrolase domain-containing protein n=1 Tax=Ustilago hordei TaxID=120017 RepID=I2FYG1_USTHO|nr:uncharacterized protein UHO2_03983 [Ustilago hordei]CCF51954.1 uncharacterized protein UHOR_05056 [Ustilago hordei]SYW86485.1 uncharacterized protein UHO2_03983 [Ustilago hordei]
MPFAWTQDRAAAPQTTSAAPSGRISASPTQSRSHRRGLAPSASISSVSTSRRSASGSQLPPPPPPSSLSLPKASTSAALTNADESGDFRRFLDEAQAKDQRQRLPQANAEAATLTPDSHRPRRPAAGADAAESLRRVASSSTLSSMHSRRAATIAGTRADQSATPAGRARKNSTISTASKAQRSLSNYSVTFRNPTCQFLEQLSVEAQTPELGIDATPIIGRTVDNKSHLTALGHAAQLQSRSTSGNQSSPSSTNEGKAPAASHPTPVRSSTIAVETPTATCSRLSTSRSPTPAQPTPAAPVLSPTARSQPLSSRHRPQSYIHKPPTEPSGVLSRRKLGATGLGNGLPTSPSASWTQSKRSAAEMERSSSLQVGAKLQEATRGSEAVPLQQSPSQPASRRKSWFGLGWAGEATDAAAEKEQKVDTGADVKDEPMEDQPPPSMSEEEAAFRRSLGYDDAYDPSASVTTLKAAARTANPRRFPAGRDLDATPKVQPSHAQIPHRERRVSWLPWRNIAPPAADEVDNPANNLAEAPAQPLPAKADDVVPHESPETQLANAAPSSAAEELPPTVASADGEDTVTYRTVVKRGWMGARYKVQEPIQSLKDIFEPPQAESWRAQEADGAASANDKAAEQSVQNQSNGANTSYPPASNSGEDARQNSGTWRWPFWSGHEGQPEPSRDSAAQQLEVPAVPTDSSAQPATNVDAAEPMDIDQNGPPADAPMAPEGGSWTYSSYVASWVPTWVYNAQQQAAASNNEGGQNQVEATASASATEMPLPRTPAEQVKADALACNSAASAAATVFDANKAVLNNSTKSGWIKFFGSRSANLPEKMAEAITADDGLEVMDISEMEGSARPAATARTIASNNGRLTPDVVRATRARTTTGGNLAGSKASSLAGDGERARTNTPLSTSKDSIKNLSKTTITKAANVTAASTLGLGKGKRTNAHNGGGTGTNGGDGGSNSQQPAKDISKGLAPGGSGPSRSGASTPMKSAADPVASAPPNLVLPSFEDTFTRAPRMWPPKVSVLERTLSAVNSYFFSKVPDLERMKRPTRYSTYGESSLGSGTSLATAATIKPTQRLAGKAKATGAGSSKDKGVETALKEVAESAQRLPRAWSTVGMHDRAQTKGTAGIGKIVVIGVHGWFTQSIFKNMIGEPTGTSAKFAAMQTESIRRHFLEAGLELNPEAITAISLQGDGKVADRVDRLFAELISRPNWVSDMKNCDALFLSAHSQGAIVATQLLARLIEQRHVHAEHTRICLLAMAGIHHGPFAHLRSSITASYISYFETAAAKELFEFQSSTTAVAQQYTAALKIILDAGAKCVYVGSTDDNVVPIYSALNSSSNHPSILRALYIDGQAFPKVDFLTNLLVLCVAIRNAGLSDHGLLTLLSASVAGSLYGGRGHSLVYEEKAVYDLATRYLFEVTHPLSDPTLVPGPPGATSSSLHTTQHASYSSSPASARKVSGSESAPKKTVMLVSEAFEAQRWNPYELPWALRGLFEDKHVRSLFAEDMLNLLKSYEQWRPDPKSKALKDLQWRLAPMRSIAPPPIDEGFDGEDEAGGKEKDKAKDDGGSGKSSKL